MKESSIYRKAATANPPVYVFSKKWSQNDLLVPGNNKWICEVQKKPQRKMSEEPHPPSDRRPHCSTGKHNTLIAAQNVGIVKHRIEQAPGEQRFERFKWVEKIQLDSQNFSRNSKYQHGTLSQLSTCCYLLIFYSGGCRNFVHCLSPQIHLPQLAQGAQSAWARLLLACAK